MKAFSIEVPSSVEEMIDVIYMKQQELIREILGYMTTDKQKDLVTEVLEISARNYATIRSYRHDMGK